MQHPLIRYPEAPQISFLTDSLALSELLGVKRSCAPVISACAVAAALANSHPYLAAVIALVSVIVPNVCSTVTAWLVSRRSNERKRPRRLSRLRLGCRQ